MHDPETLAWTIPSPIRRKSKLFPKGFRSSIVDIWHVDPQHHGSDDSCGWFMRAWHGDEAVLNRIIKRFEFDWDRTFESGNKKYMVGYFDDSPAGMPVLSVQAIALNLFFLAALEHFDKGHAEWKKSRPKTDRFMREHLFDILLFAENPTDSLNTSIARKFGYTEHRGEREQRIGEIAACIYGWILRSDRPWYKHPRYHIHHMRVRIHAITTFKRWAFSKCCRCGQRFAWGYCPTTSQWDAEGPQWFKSEKYVYHNDCRNPESDMAQAATNEVKA